MTQEHYKHPTGKTNERTDRKRGERKKRKKKIEERDIQAYRKPDRHKDRGTYIQKNRLNNRQTNRQTDS